MYDSDFPNITDVSVNAISIAPLFTVNGDVQRKLVSAIRQVWEEATAPSGLIAGYVFSSEDGESILVYLQWASAEHLRMVAKTDSVSVDGWRAEPFSSADASIYRLYKSMENNLSGAKPEKVICAFFDTHGPERQKYICDRLIELGAELPENPSALSSHFHVSLDGTRVINYTEWRDIASHDESAEAGVYDQIYEVSTTTPGVRSLRGNVYNLSLSRTF